MFATSSAQKQLVKGAEQQFLRTGWKVERVLSETQDLCVVSSHPKLKYSIKCIPHTVETFKSTSQILEDIERNTRYFRSTLNRVVVHVLDYNFLLTDLESLMNRGLFVIELGTVHAVADLANCGEGPPLHPEPRQTYLLERSIEYAVSLAEKYRANGDVDSALRWARAAFNNSSGFSAALIALFRLYRDTGQMEKAAELVNLMVHYRPNDPNILKIMRDFAKRQNDSESYEHWNLRVKAASGAPRTFEEMMRSQTSKSSVKSLEMSSVGSNPNSVHQNAPPSSNPLIRKAFAFLKRR
jgi:tetratricopeptide (TPR) repeat protein